MGHGAITTTLRHYAHAYEVAKLAPQTPMVDAIMATGDAVPHAGLRRGYTEAARRRLRQAARAR